MKFVALVLALSAASGCVRQPSASFLGDAEKETVNALRRGDFLLAQTTAESALAKAPNGDALAQWTFRLLRAESLVLQLKTVDAREVLSDAIPGGGSFDSLRARQKYVQARALLADGRLREALDAVELGSTIAATRDVKLDLDVLGGQLRLRLGQREQAESTLERVIAEAAAAGDQYHQALAFNDLGMGRVVRNRFDEALPMFERVLAFADLEPLRIYAQSLYNAGICYTELGEFERAIALQERAVRMHEQHGLTKSFEQALGELGRTYVERGDAARAVPQLQRAFEVANRAGANDDAGVWAGALAQAYMDLGRWDDAARINDEAIRIRRTSGGGRVVWNSLNVAKIAAGRGRSNEARQQFEEVIAASADEPLVRWEATVGLARLATVAGQPDRANAYYERALAISEETRSTLKRTDSRLSYLNRLIDLYREYVDDLIAQGRTDLALEVADSSRARVLAERHGTQVRHRVPVAAFRQAAEQSRRVLLFYWLDPKGSYLWVVTPGDIRFVRLPGSAAIEALVREYRDMIGSALTDPLSARDSAGARLYRTVVAPAAASIPKGAALVIVPDGALHGVNFETLPAGDDPPRYWIEDVEIQIAPSLGMLGADARRAAVTEASATEARAPQSLLLIGAPAVTDSAFPSLRFAPVEMSKIASHFDASRVVTFEGAKASPAAYRDAAPERYSMIHFSAHAAANVESPLDSAVILASAPGGGYKLYARDVAELPLQADLVTVSACRSAGERAYAGEGLVGFAWAFLRAGARRVIAGLWDADDRATADLMDRLYARLAAGEPPPSALRGAKLAVIKAGGSAAKPYFWGPLELFSVSP